MSEQWGLRCPAPAACQPRDWVPNVLSARMWVASQWKQPVQTGSSGQLTKGLPEVKRSSPPRTLMNLFPLISGVAFEGMGRDGQGSANVCASAVLGLYCFSQDTALTGDFRTAPSWTDISSLQMERQFPFLLKLSVCLPAWLGGTPPCLAWGGQTSLLLLLRQRLLQVPGGCRPPLCRGRNGAQLGEGFQATHPDARLGGPARLNAGCSNNHMTPVCPTACRACYVHPFSLQGLCLPIWNPQLSALK